jgi:DNA-binding NarL/FixJ family response regulator
MARPQPAPRPSSSNIIVAAAGGIQRDALISILRAQSRCAVTAVADDAAALRRVLATEQVRAGAARRTVAIIDAGLRGAPLSELIRDLRLEFPAVHCIALVDTAAQCAACMAAGAHAALLKDCLGEHLLAAIEG